MDKLKAILEASKPKSKINNSKSIIQEQRNNYLKEQEIIHQQEISTIQKRQKYIQQFYDQKRKLIKPNSNQIPLSKGQIYTRLRKINQPVTYFAETDLQRYQRMLREQKNRQIYPDWENKIRDQEFQRKLKQAEQYQEIDAKLRSRLIQPRRMDDKLVRQKKIQMIQAEKGQRQFNDMCDEIYLWVLKVLRDWNQTLNQKYHSPEDKIKGKPSIERYNESQGDLKSFLKVLRQRGGDKDMIASIYHIMNCCLVREYIVANDKYIQLSIGTAPWPMGVAMLGITVKRNSLRLSHVLNEQMTRKWMQAIKRMITVSQEIYPNEEKLKMVGYSVTKTV